MEYPKKKYKFKCSSCKTEWEEEVEMTGMAASSACPKCPTRMSHLYTRDEALSLIAFYINTYERNKSSLLEDDMVLTLLSRACNKEIHKNLPKEEFNLLMENIINHPLVICTKVESGDWGIRFHLTLKGKERVLELTY